MKANELDKIFGGTKFENCWK